MSWTASLGAVLIATVVVAGCSSPNTASKVPGMPARTVSAGQVEVTVTPTRLDNGGAAFTVALDTHSGSLDVDLAKGAGLTVGGTPWTNPTWTGDPAGGHHRSGTLSFSPAGKPTSDVTLTLAGFSSPVVVRWSS